MECIINGILNLHNSNGILLSPEKGKNSLTIPERILVNKIIKFIFLLVEVDMIRGNVKIFCVIPTYHLMI